MKYKSNDNFSHGDERKIGVLLVNLGTPDEPTSLAVRRYLGEFLSDPRIVEIPKFVWWIILNLIILNIRPRKSRDLYKKIWLKDGSPLLVISKSIVQKIRDSKGISDKKYVILDLAMRYGNPSIKSALENFKNQNINRLAIIPMFPQYSAATTASIFDKVTIEIQKWRNIPDVRFLSTYHDNSAYISACSNMIKSFWEKEKKSKKLVFSFHGLPQVNLHKGDPYHCYCHKTTRLISEKYKDIEIKTTFQSRFGPQEWLQPYTDKTFEILPKEGKKNILVICPGFASDCVETLEEISIQGKESFIKSGGENFEMVPCLNDSDDHISLFKHLILKNT